jgi:type I site-specific restriction-modification system R (restriction) subunit
MANNPVHIKDRLAYGSETGPLLKTTRHKAEGARLPVATFELKNSLTKQTVADAVEQYKRTRDSREKIFEFGRCVAHFAVDDAEVRFCTQLKGKDSWFLPFNQGWNDGAGNPPNPAGIKTDYLWKRMLLPLCLTDILENYAQSSRRKIPERAGKSASRYFPAIINSTWSGNCSPTSVNTVLDGAI